MKLGLMGLAALVFGMMVGAGIFNIPQNMASGAGLGAVMTSWLITAAGMLLLVYTFKLLAERHPEYNSGIYNYARAGFGRFAGFNIAWGYWLCTAFANVAYAVMLNDSFGAFFPRLLSHGWPTIVFGGAFIWTIYILVCRGLRTAKILTTILAGVKISAILLIIVLLAASFKLDIFTSDIWGNASDLGGFGKQLKSTMLVTLWCFIGIEGAVVMSARAKLAKDIGKAGVTGFLTAWLLYVMVSVFSFGVMTQARLAGLEDPSVAYVLREVCGPWAYWFVIISVIVSLGGGWFAWTLVCAEVPYTAAKSGIFPRKFMKLNSQGMPAFGLFVSSMVMQLFLCLVVTADNVYLSALNITGMMILPAYLFCGLFLTKISRADHSKRELASGIGCTAFCLWMIYAGGINLLLNTSVFYLAGIGFYLKAGREQNPAAPTFTRKEGAWLIALIAAAVYSVLL